MFESMYKKRKNPVYNIAGWALLALVCIIFMFVGYSPNVDFMGNSSSVAEVNGEVISYADFSRYYEQVQENQNSKKMTAPERMRMKNEVVDSLVNRSLIIQEAKNQDIFIPSEEMRDFLMQIPQFQDNGVFSLLKYKELVRMQGLNEARFEEKVADDMLVQKMNNLYQRVSKENALLEKHEKAVSSLTMDIEFIRKQPADLVDLAALSPEAIQKAEQEKGKEIEEYYNRNKDIEFKQDEQVQARHILIKITPQTSEKAAEEKINKIAQEVTADNFADMAKKYSEDSTKDRGGDLGFFTRGRMVREFEDAAFTQEIGKVGKPIKTSFGYHIILATDKKPARTVPLDEVKGTIAKKLLTEEATDKAVEDTNKRLAAGEANKIVSDKKWKWEDTGIFSVGDIAIPKIGDDTAVMTAALSLKPNETYSKLIKKDNAYYLIRLKSLSASGAVAKKENNMDIFQQIMERQKAYEMFQSWMEHLRKEAKVKINSKLLSM